MYKIGKQIIKSPVGFLPGRDRNCENFNRLASKGAAFIEIGPLSLHEQYVSRQRRCIFSRQPKVNYDVSNKGIRYAIANIQKKRRKCALLANITYDSKSIMVDDVVSDITKAFSLLYDFVDGFVVDTFRKNSEGSHMLQEVDFLSEVIDSLVNMRRCYEEDKPIYVRVAPNIQEELLDQIIHYLRISGVDGLIVGYDTCSLEAVKSISAKTDGRFPIIASGHTSSVEDALSYFNAGASFIQTDRRLKKIEKSILEGILNND